jgi:transcriptional regulator with XRE-family HTH domain
METVDQKKKALSELAKRIKTARTNSHLSQQDLGKYIGVSDKSISSYEKGRSQPPLDNLQKIAEATRHPMTYFTDEQTETSEIIAKLETIERELAEVRRLFKTAKKK